MLLFLFCCWGADAGAVEVGEAGVDEPGQLTPAAGFYAGEVSVTLPAGVRYTLDGSSPLSSSALARQPLILRQTTVVRYARFDAGGRRMGPVRGATYLINEPDTRLLTLSVGIDPWRLFDAGRGWFRPGHGADPGHWKQPGANWWTQREHPAHVDLIETDGRCVYGGTVGYRMFGGMSRLHPQKSFSLAARKRYGGGRVRHPVFGPEGGKSFKFLVARNGGSDWNRSYVRDALLTGLLRDESWDLDRQAARPVQVYLNGRYWGIYHLREKINATFLADRHKGLRKQDIDLLEHQQTVKQGRLTDYRALLAFVRDHDLSVPAHYRRLGELMDVDNYMRWQIAQTYFDNRDAGGNIRYWRSRTAGGRWRWILYDVDQGFGLHSAEAYQRNTLAFYTAPDGPAWPNPPWSTFLQRKLLANAEYRRRFVNRSLDYLHTDFAPVRVLAAVNRAATDLRYDMARQQARWRGKDAHWAAHLERLRTFARERPAYLREHLRSFVGGGPDRTVRLTATPGGYVLLNDNLRVDETSLTGDYLAGLPLDLRAVAHPGFRFVGWADAPDAGADRTLDLRQDRTYVPEAVFESYDHPLAGRVVINEIHPYGRAGGDWVELHNRSAETVDLTGWRLTDHRHAAVLPAARVAAGDYVVVCRDADRLRRAHPAAHNVVEGLTFGLARAGERIGLYGPAGGYVDDLTYPAAPADTAFVHALVLPDLDNSDPRHWATEAGAGTPCAANPAHLRTSVITRQGYWLRIGVGAGVLVLLAVVRVLRGER